MGSFTNPNSILKLSQEICRLVFWKPVKNIYYLALLHAYTLSTCLLSGGGGGGCQHLVRWERRNFFMRWFICFFCVWRKLKRVWNSKLFEGVNILHGLNFDHTMFCCDKYPQLQGIRVIYVQPKIQVVGIKFDCRIVQK